MFFNQVLAAGAALIAVANGLAPPPNGPNAAPKGPLTPANGPKGPHSPKDGWPNAPFATEGRDVVNSKGETVTFAGINCWQVDLDLNSMAALTARSQVTARL